MNFLNKNDIRKLVEKQQSPCVSIYLPTYQKGAEVEQNPIRFKNLVKKVETKLNEQGFREPEIKDFLNPAFELLDNSNFWEYQSDGLMFFLSPEDFYYYRLPISFDEHAIVSERYYIKPLVPLLSGEEGFFVLALNLNEVKLYQASGFSINEIQSEDIPKSIEEILKYDDPEKQLQFHTGTGIRKGRRDAMFHGHGVGKNDKLKKKNILRFFQAVEKGVQKELAGENSPLVLVGFDYLIPIYREANSYPNLFDKAVDSNPADLSQDELHQKTWEKIQPYFQQAKDDALSEYHELLSKGKASNDVKEIVKAAHHDRIKNLFVDLKEQCYGKYDSDDDNVEIYEQHQNKGEDLADLATMRTLMRGGKVYNLESEDMPSQSPLAAVFRF